MAGIFKKREEPDLFAPPGNPDDGTFSWVKEEKEGSFSYGEEEEDEFEHLLDPLDDPHLPLREQIRIEDEYLRAIGETPRETIWVEGVAFYKDAFLETPVSLDKKGRPLNKEGKRIKAIHQTRGFSPPERGKRRLIIFAIIFGLALGVTLLIEIMGHL